MTKEETVEVVKPKEFKKGLGRDSEVFEKEVEDPRRFFSNVFFFFFFFFLNFFHLVETL